jgi:hypothetical protein
MIKVFNVIACDKKSFLILISRRIKWVGEL